MREGDFLLRLKDKVIRDAWYSKKVLCDSKEIKKFIREWTENEGWKFKDFSEFIRLVGIQTPAKLSKLNKETGEFKCIKADGKEVCIRLYFGDKIDFCSEIYVTDGDETKGYVINSQNIKNEYKPEVTLQTRDIKREQKELNSFYSKFFCSRTLYIDDTHKLIIEIAEPDKYKDKSEIKVLRNCRNIEEYLLGLDNSLNIHNVYAKLMEMLLFSSYDIAKCEYIYIGYIEEVDKKRHELRMINGKFQYI